MQNHTRHMSSRRQLDESQTYRSSSASSSANKSRRRPSDPQNPMSISNLLNPDHPARNVSRPHQQDYPRPHHQANSLGGRRHLHGPRLPESSSSMMDHDEQLKERRRIQSEKKRQWRRNLSPEQKERRQMQDAQRKREQRQNLSPEQRAEARRRDAARKAMKRRQSKDKMEREERDAHGQLGARLPHHLSQSSHSNHLSRPGGSSASKSLQPNSQVGQVEKLDISFRHYSIL